MAAERELAKLNAQDTKPPSRSTATNAYARILDDFAFKAAPLYVVQIESSPDPGDHLLFVSVDLAPFCLLSHAAQRQAVEAVFLPADRLLRAAGIRDFEFVLVGVSQRAPRRKDALAVGKSGRLMLTARSRRC